MASVPFPYVDVPEPARTQIYRDFAELQRRIDACCGGSGDPVSPTTVLSQLFATAGAQSSYTTSSVSPAQNRAYVLFFYDHASATPAVVPSAVGCGLTWTPVYSSTVSDPGTRLTVFKGVGAPTGGTITVTLGHSNGVSAGVILLALAGIDNTNPVVQASHGEAFAGMSLSVTLGAFSSASNRPVGFFAVAETTGAANFTAGTDFSIISGAHSSAAGTSDNYDISVNAEWRDAEDNVVDGSVSLVNEWKWLVALELRAG